MNILQMEDIVKGLPDQQLFQEAQAPSGQIPQFLTVSEIQRRTQMRKRYEAQQPQPEGTVAEQIVQQGIMGLAPQGAQPMQQMASGGQVRGMAAGGFTWPVGGYNYTYTGDQSYPNDLALYEAWLAGQIPPEMIKATLSPDEQYQIQFDPQGNLLRADMSGPIVRDEVMGPPADLAGSPRQSFADRVGENLGQAKDFMGMALGEGSFALNKLRNFVQGTDRHYTGPEDEPDDRSWWEKADALMSWPMDPVFTGDKESGSGGILDMNPFARSRGAGYEPTQTVSGGAAAATPGVTEQPSMVDELGIAGLGALSGNEDWAGIPFRKDIKRGGTGAQTQATDDARLDLTDPATDTEDALARLLGMDVKSPDVPDMSAQIAEARKDALNSALIQLGAGIANDDVGGGIRNAGIAAMQGRQDARSLEGQMKLLKYKSDVEDIDREIGRLYRAGTIEASAVRSVVDQAIENGRADRAVIDAVLKLAIEKYPEEAYIMNPQQRARDIDNYIRGALPERLWRGLIPDNAKPASFDRGNMSEKEYTDALLKMYSQ